MSLGRLFAAAAFWVAACGGTQPAARQAPRAEPDAGLPEHDSFALDTSADVVLALAAAAQAVADCGVTAQASQEIAITCGEDTIFFRQRDTEVEWTCQAPGHAACRALAEKLVPPSRRVNPHHGAPAQDAGHAGDEHK